MVKCMKIVKRNGQTVDYNPDKIRIAIGKANNEVNDAEKISDEKIEKIIAYIEGLDKKRMLVEDIQDIIEFKLMEYDRFVLAKKYIIYRYVRSIIRQSNTTDASILSLLKNGNGSVGNYLVANKQRDVMAGEASKDLAYRLLLPHNVVEKDILGTVKFAKVEYFTEPVIESAKINLRDMFENGTVINGIKIDCPKGFQSACNILVEIIGAVASCQTGEVIIDLKDLFKYYDLTYEKKYSLFESLMKNTLTNEQIRALSETQTFLEVKTGIQTIFYELNTISISGSVPKVTFLIDVSDIESVHDEKMVYEFVRQKVDGIKNFDGQSIVTSTPSLIMCLNNESSDEDRYDYILKELIGSNVEFTMMNSKRYRAFLHEMEKFNQGSMILNLGKLALEASDKNDFMESLDDALSCCYEGFLCRNHNLQGVYSDKSPIHWMYGGIARLESNERIDTYLKKEYSYMKLVVLGFEASIKVLNLSNEDKKSIRNRIQNEVKNWNKDNSFGIEITNYCEDEVERNLYSSDSDKLKKYGVTSYFDSYSFMKEDYFKDGFLYFEVFTPIDIESDCESNSNFICSVKNINS